MSLPPHASGIPECFFALLVQKTQTESARRDRQFLGATNFAPLLGSHACDFTKGFFFYYS